MVKFIVVIPARLSSTRLSHKPLANIHGKPMVVHVAARAAESGAARVLVATDHDDVIAACTHHGADAILTRADHATGTDRLADVATQLQLADDAIVVNVQGDEPLIDPAIIRAVATLLTEKTTCAIATAAHPIANADDFFNPNVVKLVTDAADTAHYFSRAPIPWARDHFANDQDKTTLPPTLGALRHIGIYAYRARFLKRFTSLPPAPTEQVEALEQLRALYHGEKIAVLRWQSAIAAGVDTPEDLARMRALPAELFG